MTNPRRVRAIFGSVADNDVNYAELLIDPNTCTVTASGTPVDGPYTWNVARVQGAPIPITHVADVTGGEDLDDIRDGWAATPITGDLALYLRSIVTTGTGQVRVTFQDNAPPLRLQPLATPNDPTSTIVLGTDDCFPTVFYVPPGINQVVVSFDPVNYSGDPVTNVLGTPLDDDNGMAVGFELIKVLNRQEPFGAEEDFGVGSVHARSYKRTTTVTSNSVQVPYVFDDITPGLWAVRVYSQAMTPTDYEGTEVWVELTTR